MVMERDAVGGGVAAAAGSTPRSGYAPTYYPGTTNAPRRSASRVAVGQEARAPTSRWCRCASRRITGIVIGSDGKPLEGAMITLRPRNGARDRPA